jgi:hypothetical protein
LQSGKNKFFYLLLFCVTAFYSSAQVLKGKVTNADGKQGISFAMIALDQSNKGTSCDIDGNFSIQLSGNETSLTIQMIGYEKKVINLSEIDPKALLLVKLKTEGISLDEVQIKAGEDPANIIIKKVISLMPKYDIANLPYYSCNTYAKTYFTLSDKKGDEDFYNKDPAKNKELKKMLDKSYLLLIESVTEKKYRHRDKYQEKILASKVSGFKSAPFGAFATQLQSFTFYSDNIELLGVKYLNPLSSGTFRRYKFNIVDTLLEGVDTTIIIGFEPKKNPGFKAMKGLLYIYKNEYAISKVLAEPAVIEKKGNGIKVQQSYVKIRKDVWFPDQVNTELMMSTVSADSDNKDAIMKGVSRVYVKDVNLDSAVKIKNSSIEVYNAGDFDKKDDKYWYEYRRDTLNIKEINTYRIIDSIGKKAQFDQKVKLISVLMKGKIPLGNLDIDLKHVIRVNEYENVRLGLGLSTSDKVSRWFSIGAYAGYGFRDKANKYGGSLRMNMDRSQTNYWLAEAASDIEESAGTFFHDDNGSMFSTQKFRDLFVSKMDIVNYGKLSLNLSPVNRLKTSLYAQVQDRTTSSGYHGPSDSIGTMAKNKFIVNTVGLQLCYRPGEKFIETFGQMLPKGSKYPVIYLNVMQGLKEQIDIYKGELDFTRIDLRIDHRIDLKIRGSFSWQIQAGKVIGDVPYSFQYNNKGSRMGLFSVSVEKTFETMYLNEFVSTEYAAAFVAFNFGPLFKAGSKFNPEIELMHNYGIGNFTNKDRYTNIELNDISKGYTEAGLRIKNILRSNFTTFGAGVFYRYGNYAYDNEKYNFVYKLVIGFSV